MNLTGTYAGYVEATNDPERLGRLKVRVPTVYGPTADGGVGLPDLPWAMPAGLPAGASDQSGAIAWLPNVGDQVYVRFLDGEPEKPLWEWAGQTQTSANQYPYWRRQPGGYGQDGTAPRSALLTRYGHAIDFQEDLLLFRTNNGYKLRFNDAEAQLDLYVPTWLGLVETWLMTGRDYKFSVAGPFAVDAATASISANEISLTALNNTLTAVLSNKLRSPQVELGPEGTAVDPVVRYSDLLAVVTSLITQWAVHTHQVVGIGKPTTPPTKPLVLVPTASQVTFTA